MLKTSCTDNRSLDEPRTLETIDKIISATGVFYLLGSDFLFLGYSPLLHVGCHVIL
jgi:hypothetical protein